MRRTYASGWSRPSICAHRLCARISTSWTTSSASARSFVSTVAKRTTASSRVAANCSNVIRPASRSAHCRRARWRLGAPRRVLSASPGRRAGQPVTLSGCAWSRSVPSLTEAIAATDRSLLVGVDRLVHASGRARRGRASAAPRTPTWPRSSRWPRPGGGQRGGEPRARSRRAARRRAGGLGHRDPQPGRRVQRTRPSCSRPHWDGRSHRRGSRPRGARGIRSRRRSCSTAVIPIWRRPWMFVGSDTFAGDLLRAPGDRQRARPTTPSGTRRSRSTSCRPSELVVLPDEPYAFTAADGPEAFPDRRPILVSGRDLTWYGPSLVEAPARLQAALARGWTD